MKLKKARTQNNQLTFDGEYRYTYDDEGNRATKGKTRYYWDHRNRLVKVVTPKQTVEYQYDYRNRLTRRNDECFVHDNWQIACSLKSGKIADRYFWGTRQDELLSGNDDFVLTDHLGTIRRIVEKTGNTVSDLKYNAFGKLVSCKGALPRFRYTGKLFDDTAELQWNINRWYDPNVGRWISEDPIGFRGKALNKFSYVSNSPVRATDFLGLVKDDIVKHGILFQNDFTVHVDDNTTIPLTLNTVNNPPAINLPSNYKVGHFFAKISLNSVIEELTCCFRPKFTIYGHILIMLRPSDDQIVVDQYVTCPSENGQRKSQQPCAADSAVGFLRHEEQSSF